MASASPKLQRTRDYKQFAFTKENREVELLNLKPQHKKLRKSMETYGFLPSFPVTVTAINGRFVIKDGQHRFTFAKELGLEVWFVIIDADIDIAAINQAQAGWSMRDFASKWANSGRSDYRKALDFADRFAIPVGSAFSMLAGTIIFKNISNTFHDGAFKIKAEQIATRVATCYQALCLAKPGMKNAHLLSSIWGCCHVPYFDETRLIETAQRRPELMTSCGTREAFLSMLEEIYNYAKRQRQPLRFDAEEAMRQRNPRFKTTDKGAA